MTTTGRPGDVGASEPPGSPSRRSSVAAAGMLNAGASLIGLAAGFGAVVIVTRQRGAADAGVLFGAIALFSLLGTATKLGTETTFVYVVGRMRAAGQLGGLRPLLRVALAPTVACSAAVGLVLALAADALGGILIDADHASTYAATLRGLAPFLPAWSVSLALLGVTRGLGTIVPTALALQVAQPVLQLAGIAVGVWAGAGVPVLAVLWAGPLVVTAMIAAAVVARAVSAAPDDGDPPLTSREFWSYATPRGAAGTLNALLDRSAVVLVAAVGSAELAGAWTAITRVVGVALRLVHTIGQGLNSRLGELMARPDRRDAAATTRDLSWWTAVLLTPVLVPLLSHPGAVLDVFGVAGVHGAPWALRGAAIAVMVTAWLAHVDNVLLMAGRSGLVLRNGLGPLALLVAATAVSVPVIGLPGAAWAWVASSLAYRLTCLAQVRRQFGFWVLGTDGWRDSAIVLAGATAGAFALREASGAGPASAVVAGIASVAATAAVVAWRRGRTLAVTSR